MKFPVPTSERSCNFAPSQDPSDIADRPHAAALLVIPSTGDLCVAALREKPRVHATFSWKRTSQRYGLFAIISQGIVHNSLSLSLGDLQKPLYLPVMQKLTRCEYTRARIKSELIHNS